MQALGLFNLTLYQQYRAAQLTRQADATSIMD
jgi:hypothetical protein